MARTSSGDCSRVITRQQPPHWLHSSIGGDSSRITRRPAKDAVVIAAGTAP
jgi:hypothetical protein